MEGSLLKSFNWGLIPVLLWYGAALWGGVAAKSDSMDYGLTTIYREDYISKVHEEILLGVNLEKRLTRDPVELEVSGKQPSQFLNVKFRFKIHLLTPMSYASPTVSSLITEKDGIRLRVDVQNITLRGKYKLDHLNGDWLIEKREGDVSVRALGVSLKMKREIVVASNMNVFKWRSSGCVASIRDLELDLHDEGLRAHVTQVHLDEWAKRLGDGLCNLAKEVLDVENDMSYNLTNEIYLDTQLVSLPRYNHGSVELHHKAEMRFRGDKRHFSPGPMPQHHPANPNSMVSYQLSDCIFNSLGFVVHNNKLVSFKFTKADLPANRKHSLDTTCVKECFGELFPRAAVAYPNSTAEISVSTETPPKAVISPEGFTVFFDFAIKVNVRQANGKSHHLFTARLIQSGLVDLHIRDKRLVLEVQTVKSDIAVPESKIGLLPLPSIRAIIEESFSKVSFVTTAEMKGVDLRLPSDFSISHSRITFDEGTVSLFMEFLDTLEPLRLVKLPAKLSYPLIENISIIIL